MESAPVLVEVGGEGSWSVEVTFGPLLCTFLRCKGEDLHHKRVMLFDGRIGATLIVVELEDTLAL